MTLFQNIGGDLEFFDPSGRYLARIKSGSVFHGKRVDEWNIWMQELGVISCFDNISNLFTVKEMMSMTDAQFMMQVMDPKGWVAQTQTFGMGGTWNNFLVPCGSTVSIHFRYYDIESGEQKYFISYQGETGWVAVSSDQKVTPLSRPLLYRVIQREGCVVRETKELCSRILGVLPCNSLLVVVEKDFSDLPSNNHAPCLRLDDNKGWITYSPFTVDLIGYATPSIRKRLHRQGMDSLTPCPTVLSKAHKRDSPCCSICYENTIDAAFIHGETAHSVACLSCARKWFQTKNGCPVCRLGVEKVVMNFSQ